MEIVQIAHTAVNARLVNASREVKLEVQRQLSYKVAGSEHMSAFKSGTWDGRSSFLDFNDGTFPRGFVTLVQQALMKKGYKVQVVKKPYPLPLGPENPVVDDFGGDPRYDYQPEIARRLLKHGQIIAQVATGGGKSRIARICTARINRPTLFLTTRGVLMYQMAESYEAMGKKVAILGDGNLQVSKDVTCGMVQTIMAWLETTSVEQEMERYVTAMLNREDKEAEALKVKLKKEKKNPLQIGDALTALRERQEKERMPEKEVKTLCKAKADKQAQKNAKMIEVLNRFEFVILEEAHEASGNSYYEILRHCKNAHYRLALTGTPFMKDDEEANMRLMASSGPIAIKVTELMLIERGILAKPYFKYVTLPQTPKNLYKSTPWQRAYELGIVENEYRNKHIVAETIRAYRYGLPVMILVQHKKHGKLLQEAISKAGLQVDYIFGEDNQKERKAALQRLKNGHIHALIGSTILDVGVDVPAVGMVILAGGGKAEVALRQRIGRGLRAKKFGPNVAFIVDFADALNNHLRTHYMQRRAVVEATPGFAEGIVVNDFDFAACGLDRKVA